MLQALKNGRGGGGDKNLKPPGTSYKKGMFLKLNRFSSILLLHPTAQYSQILPSTVFRPVKVLCTYYHQVRDP